MSKKYDFSKNLCFVEECEQEVKSNCVFYVGEDLPNLGIKNGDSLTSILKNLDVVIEYILKITNTINISSQIDCDKLKE